MRRSVSTIEEKKKLGRPRRADQSHLELILELVSACHDSSSPVQRNIFFQEFTRVFCLVGDMGWGGGSPKY